MKTFTKEMFYGAIYFPEFHGKEFLGYDYMRLQEHNLILGSGHLEDGE
jgi:hypothetical protein